MSHQHCICAEYETLRKDAMRYRWLRAKSDAILGAMKDAREFSSYDEYVDAAIDAEPTAEKSPDEVREFLKGGEEKT